MPSSPRRSLLSISDRVILPHEIATVDVRRTAELEALFAAGDAELSAIVSPTAPGGGSEHGGSHSTATLVRILDDEPLAGPMCRLVLRGLRRVRIEGIDEQHGAHWATISSVPTGRYRRGARLRAQLERLAELVERAAEVLTEPDVDAEGALSLAHALVDGEGELDRCTDLVAASLPLDTNTRHALLEEARPKRRLDALVAWLETRLSITHAPAAPAAPAGTIRSLRAPEGRTDAERSEAGTSAHELARFERRLRELDLPETAHALLLRELDYLRRCGSRSPAAASIRSHVEWALELPWPSARQHFPTLPFEKVVRNLERSHVGLEDVKRRIAEILAIRQLGGGARGTVLCFQGPPGTGKSSMARAVAAALGRSFVTIPVGAMIHERELVGVSPRRDGASPGAILAGIHRSGTPDPVVLLDEIDKIALGGEGTAAGALLLLLDPEHNAEFLDHYLGVPFDLSRCLFLATANDTETLPESLADRMEVLPFHGYTEKEKISIARQHLLPRARTHAGLEKNELRLTNGALRALVRGYTEEAGVRHLGRLLVALGRKSAMSVVGGGEGLVVKKDDLTEHLGPRTVEEELRLRRPVIGVATGLAWTSVGGSLLPTELLTMPGSGRTILTGQVGDVMRESAQTAISYVRSAFGQLGLAPDHLDELDLHLHFPSAATPKDGPSAGIAIAAALVSLLTGRPARHDVAMTGEMSLLGAVLPVGGLREKLLAAIRCGIPEVIIPARNAEDEKRLPSEIHEQLTIHRVQSVDEVFGIALVSDAGPSPAPTLGHAGPRQVARRAKRADDA